MEEDVRGARGQGGKGVTDPRALPSAVTLEDVLRAGREALARGSVAGALRTFDEALRIKPTYAPAWKAKGRAHRAAGDPKMAVECYAEALRYEPADEGSWFGLALALHEVGRLSEELEAYDEILRRNPRNSAAWMNRGVALHEGNKFEEALECYNRILSLQPESAPAWNNRGAALLRLGRHEEALTALDEALALDPGLEDAMANRQTVLVRLRRAVAVPAPIEFAEVSLPPAPHRRVLANLGLASVEEWRQSRPQSSEEYVSFATTLLDAGMPDGALAAFAKAVSLGAGAEARLGKVQALQARKDQGAFDEAVRALAAHPDVPRVAITSARLYEEAGDLAGAIGALDVVLGRRPDLSWLWAWKGHLCLRSGRNEDAVLAFQRAVAGDPGDDWGWANLAAALHLSRREEEALAACESGLAAASSSPAAWNNKAVVLAALGRADEADRALHEAVAHGGKGPALLNRARLAETRQQFRSAFDFYGEALEALPGDPEAVAGRRRVTGHLGAQGRARRDRITDRIASIPGLGLATASRILEAGFDTPAKVRKVQESVLREKAKLTRAQARAVKHAFTS